MSLQAIIFDLFHTLVDPEDFRPKAFKRNEALAALLEADKEEFTSYWKRTTKLRASSNKRSIEFIREFQEAKGRACSASLLASADEIIGRYQDLAIMNPREEVVIVLKLLRERGLRIGLLSNAEEREVSAWSQSPLEPYFDSVAFSYLTGHLKPDYSAYEDVLKGVSVEAQNCAYVGDGGSGELVGAQNAGFGLVVFMSYFAATNGFRTEDELKEFSGQSDITVREYQELPGRLVI